MSGLLEPYHAANGGWTGKEAVHLLWRCAAGASVAEVNRAVREGMTATVERLVSLQPEDEEFAATEKLLHRSALKSDNIGSLKNWWLYRFLRTANPLVEKMCLLWHNHFATSNVKVRSTGKMNNQHELIRKHALGNFAELFRSMARDVAMLVWLDGNANRKRHPNENFAREVMELFALGVGNYRETDIKEAARAFTGWHVRKDEFWFNRIQHDKGVKEVLGKSGNFTGDDILEICLSRKACTRFLASKLLRAFVTPTPEPELLDALAERIRFHQFEMVPVLRELLSSQAFYAAKARQVLIKSPVELVVGAFRTAGGQANLGECVQLLADLGQNLFEPPTVKGWEGGRLWINSATMLQRANFAAQVTSGKRFGKLGAALPRGGSIEEQVASHFELLLAGMVSPATREAVMKYFRGAGGTDQERQNGLVHLIMTMPEYQLI